MCIYIYIYTHAYTDTPELHRVGVRCLFPKSENRAPGHVLGVLLLYDDPGVRVSRTCLDSYTRRMIWGFG